MKTVSKSKILSCRQCPKRMWLEVNQPELLKNSASAEQRFLVGHEVGAVARSVFDPQGKGVLLDAQKEGYEATFQKTTDLIEASRPIFEAGFRIHGAMCFADILLPTTVGGGRAWRMIEVKSAASVKDYHRDDIAIQTKIAEESGVALTSAELAHLDTSWTYLGNQNYEGIFVTHNLLDEARGRSGDVATWICEAQTVLAKAEPPNVEMGEHCTDPFECGFIDHCAEGTIKPKCPVNWLPRIQAKALKAYIAKNVVTDMSNVPDDLLNEIQLRVKRATLTGEVYFDAVGAARDLHENSYPAYFLDFETAQFAIPIWVGTRPYQQLPFQFSVHKLSRDGSLDHLDFLDLSGKDPMRSLAEALIASCGERGPIYGFNASFEQGRIKELAAKFPDLKDGLLPIAARMIDLLKIARERYYHPEQEGSWSIKNLLPTIAPDLNYENLQGIREGAAAGLAYLEAIHPNTSDARRAELDAQLRAYCAQDTLGTVRVFEKFMSEARSR